MRLPISPRLLACAGFVSPGARVADVGTDHGYLTIYLRLEGIASYVYAADIAPQPLDSARANAKKYGVTSGVSFHLCDGVRGLPRDFDTLVVAGLGADTMISILSSAPWLRAGAYRVILQCQSSQNELRKYLSENGWQICREEPVRDGRFIYTVMELCPGQELLTPGQHFCTPALLRSKSSLVREHIAFCRSAAARVVEGTRAGGGERHEYYSKVLKELTEMEEQL